jgi:hypothetical protein
MNGAEIDAEITRRLSCWQSTTHKSALRMATIGSTQKLHVIGRDASTAV